MGLTILLQKFCLWDIYVDCVLPVSTSLQVTDSSATYQANGTISCKEEKELFFHKNATQAGIIPTICLATAEWSGEHNELQCWSGWSEVFTRLKIKRSAVKVN